MKKYTLKNLMDEHSAQHNDSGMTQKRLQHIVNGLENSEIIEEETGYVLFKEDFTSALKQVHNLAKSFGKTYSSAQIEFTKKK